MLALAMAEIYSIDDLRRAAQAPPAESTRSWSAWLAKSRKLHDRIEFRGLDISIENRAGSIRHWTDHAGKKGQTKLTLPYGYIRGTVGADGDHVDCFVGPNQNAPNVYVIDTAKKPDFTEFDEHKCMLGFSTGAEARAALLANYDDPRVLMGMVSIPFERFTEWMTSRKHTKAPATTGALALVAKSERLFQAEPGVTYADLLKAHAGAGPFIGPRGGKWADPQHTVAWQPPALGAPPHVMNLEQFASATGGKTDSDVEMYIHAGLRSKPGTKTYARWFERTRADLSARRDATKAAYRAAIAAGHIVAPPPRTLAEIAEGVPGTAADAAKRVIEKRRARRVESVVKQSEIDSLGIPREAMPQIIAEHRDEFLAGLSARGIKHEQVQVAPTTLKPTQAVTAKGIERVTENSATDKPIIVSSDNRVLDGHHRWAHGLAHSPDAKFNAIRIDLPIHRLIEEARGFAKVEFRATAKSMSIQSDILTAPFRGENPVRTTQTAEEKGTDKDSQKQQLRDSGFSDQGVKDLAGKMTGGPFIGPRGGKWADAAHTIPWKQLATKPDSESKYPVAEPPQYGHTNYKATGGRMETMTPAEYLRIAPPLSRDEETEENIGIFVEHMKSGRTIDPPMLAYDDAGKLTHHDGRHRALAAQKLGMKSIPVLTFGAPRVAKSNQIQQPNRIGAPMFTIQSGTLQKGAIIAHPTGGGWGPIPRGMHGGFRKRHGSGWAYWYPKTGRMSGANKPAAEWDETHFLASQFDTDPSHWHFVRAVAGQTAIVGWTQGGIDPQSAHPVKIAGQEHKLYRITNPEPQPGWAELVNVNDASDTHSVRHERIYPVEYGIHVPKLVARPPAPAWEPGARPTAAPPIGPVTGSEKHLPAYGASTAKHGSYLAKVEGGHYPSRDVRRYEPDADGTPRIIRARTLYMPDMDKLGLLTEFAPLIRKIARNTSRTFGLAHDAIPDLNSAAMEGMLVAIDSYPGGTSFGRHAGSIATDYARLHAAREFAGGIAMPRRHARLLRTFIAAKAEAARTHETGTPSVEEVAKMWRVRKRDVHPGLDKDAGRDELIPMQNYGLRGAQFAPGNENHGRIALAERYLQFLEGQHKEQGAAFFDDDAAIFRATESTGGGLAPHEKDFIRHAVSEALEQLRNHRVTIGRREWRSDAAQLIRRRLGLDTDAETPLTIARHVPVHWLDRKGEWHQVSPRRATDVIDAIVADGLEVAKRALGGEAAGAVTRAQAAVLPVATTPGGPTAGDRFAALAHAVTREEVRAWRQGERERLRKLGTRYRSEGDSEMVARVDGRMRYLNGIGLHRARAIIAQRKLFSTPRALSWFRTAIPLPIEPEAPVGKRYTAGTMTVTDPSTGKQRSLRVSRLTDLSAPPAPSAVRKSEAQVESDTHEVTADEAIAVRMHAAFPNLARLLFASHDGVVDAPGRERDGLLELMGYA